MNIVALIHFSLMLIFAPLLLGVINRTKAFFAGRIGQPLLQSYWDLWKLLKKDAVYSRTTTWIFRAGPIVGLASTLAVATLVPFGGAPALLPFSGDIILFAYMLGLARFFTILAALDTGSSFEGMGASREAQFATLAEPALLLGFAVLAHLTGSFSLSTIYTTLAGNIWMHTMPAMLLVSFAFLIVLLAENARIPFDDPNTHLELTMIHEVMALDHGGPDFGFILYGAALKLWVFGSLLIGIALPLHKESAWLAGAVFFAGMLGLAILIGAIESCMARLRLIRIPYLLVVANVLAVLALILVLR